MPGRQTKGGFASAGKARQCMGTRCKQSAPLDTLPGPQFDPHDSEQPANGRSAHRERKTEANPDEVFNKFAHANEAPSAVPTVCPHSHHVKERAASRLEQCRSSTPLAVHAATSLANSGGWSLVPLSYKLSHRTSSAMTSSPAWTISRKNSISNSGAAPSIASSRLSRLLGLRSSLIASRFLICPVSILPRDWLKCCNQIRRVLGTAGGSSLVMTSRGLHASVDVIRRSLGAIFQRVPTAISVAFLGTDVDLLETCCG